MVGLIAPLVVAIVVGVIVFFRTRRCGGLGVMGGIFAFALASILLGGIKARCPVTMELSGQYDIVSLRDESVTSGSFVLGSGTIGESSVFATYIKTSPTSFVRRYFPTYASEIIETDSAPRLEVWEVKTLGRWRFIGPTFFAREGSDNNRQYRFCVPPGTVIRQFGVGGQ